MSISSIATSTLIWLQALAPGWVWIKNDASTISAIAALLSSCAAFLAVKSQSRALAQQSSDAKAERYASIVSAARLTWIDNIRDDISEYLAISTTRLPGLGEYPEAYSEYIKVRHRQSLLRARIEFRLDKSKQRQGELIDALDDVTESSGALHAMALARELFDGEWVRVKAEAAGQLRPPPS